MVITKKRANGRFLIATIAAIIAIVFIFWQWDAILKSIDSLKTADSRYILLAIFTFTLSVFAAAGVVYQLIINNNLKFAPILTVQSAGLFLGRVTPASVGAIGAMIRLLVTQRHSVVQATSIMGAVAFCTFLGNVLISSLALLLASRTIELSQFTAPSFVLWIVAILAVAITILFLINNLRKKMVSFVKDTIYNLKLYKNKKTSVLKAVLLGSALTLMYGSTMLLVAYSLGVELSLFAAIITVSLGSLGVAVTPLPGGAVGAEAAIAASLAQFGVATDIALAVALVYRAITFWIPLLPGFFASQYALKKEYL